MNSGSALAALQHSEELLVDESIVRRMDVDLLQYDKRDYSFWDEDFFKRSINRLMLNRAPVSTASGELTELHPLDSQTSYISREEEERRRDEILDFPEVFKTRVYGERSVSTLQEWECVVEDVDDLEVKAIGKSLIDISPEENVIAIPLQEFAPSDRDKLRPGVMFRLIIGLSKKANGMRTREAICYLRKATVDPSNWSNDFLDGL